MNPQASRTSRAPAAADREHDRLAHPRGVEVGVRQDRADPAVVRRVRPRDAALHQRRGVARAERRQDVLHAQPRHSRAARGGRGLRLGPARPRHRRRPRHHHRIGRQRHHAGDADAGRSRRQRGAGDAALAELRRRGDGAQRRAAAGAAEVRRRALDARSRPAVRRVRRAHPRDLRQLAGQSDRLDGEGGGSARDPRFLPQARHLGDRRRGLRAPRLRPRRGAVAARHRGARRPGHARSTASPRRGA